MKELAIDESHLHEIEHLLAQSMNGLHLLFDNRTIARILQHPSIEVDLFARDNADKIEILFGEFIQKASFQEKQVYLGSLDPASFELLLRTYFHIVENSLLAAECVRH